MSSKVKSLELQGYKTFASSTVFEFADTVTAIVGPNGSGKSNIVDALRWVLGEQSYSLLRGKKTEDMIFAGSEQRARAGMASATLTFNNETEWLPIDFSEVAITRRAYRDGQNEYVLNGQRVRLKDVSELLSKSGLAERTYTIIGQGLVDAALSLKAEERRRLFEEAAGIGLYRLRREEAIRRLEKTQRNIERVQDILTELRPHLRSLERQAEKARDFERIKADLRLVLKDWYGYHWHRAQNELVKMRTGSRNQQHVLATARRQQESFDKELKGIRQNIFDFRGNLKEWGRKAAELQSEREILRREIAVADERIRSNQEQYANIKSELVRADEEQKQREMLLKKAKINISQQNTDFKATQIRAASAIEDLQAAQVSRLVVENDLKGVRSSLSELIARKSYLVATLNGHMENVESKRKDFETLALTLHKSEAGYDQKKIYLQRRSRQLNQCNAIRVNLQEKIKQFQTEKSAFDDSIKAGEDRKYALVNERDRLQVQLDLVKRSEYGLTVFAGGARKVVETENLWKPSIPIGILRELLDIPDEYLTAISAVLGEYLDLVLIKQDITSDNILDMLKSEGTRGAFLSLDSLRFQTERFSVSSIEGYIGIAADLVGKSSNIDPAVEVLLGGVLVVSHREAARQVLSQLREENNVAGNQSNVLRVATLDGEVFFLNGIVIGGKENRAEGLKLQKQHNKIQNRLQNINQELIGIEDDLRQEELRSVNLSKEDKEIQQQLAQAEHDLEIEKKLNIDAEFDLDRSQTQIELIKYQNKILETELGNYGSQLPELKSKISQIEDLITRERGYIDQNESVIDEDHPLDDLRMKAMEWKTDLAVLERGVTDAKHQFIDRQTIYERAHADYIALQCRLVEIEKSKVLLLEKKDELVRKEIEVGKAIAELKELIDPAERSLAEKENLQQDLLIKDGEARQTLNLAEHQFAQARIALAQRQESMETLKRRIEDDFGLVDFRYSDGISGPKPLPIEGMVEQLPKVEELPADIEDTLNIQRASMRRLGAINPEAQVEYHEIRDRCEFLTDQIDDLEKAEADIREVINELDVLMQREFQATFTAVAEEFSQIFTRLFGGGSARLVITNPEDIAVTGIDIEARLPGRREQGLSLLSGGERSLAATSLVFALLKVSPTPFCVLDEVDAMLDESNTGRFRDLLNELSQNTQFVVITHNRNTVQVADVVYGITMGRDSSSQIISLKMEEVMKAEN